MDRSGWRLSRRRAGSVELINRDRRDVSVQQFADSWLVSCYGCGWVQPFGYGYQAECAADAHRCQVVA